jgi:DNA-nicking Smr family endonuclease
MDPVVVPINGVLDLHTFAPGDLKNLMPDYIDACLDVRIYALRIIHGKGSGVMRNRVRSLLGKDPRVRSFQDAPETAGGWGATLVTLRKVNTRT